MVKIAVMNNQDGLYKVISQKESEGYLKIKLAVIGKNKLHLDDLHNSQISLMATSGLFSDHMSRLFTGEDGEETVLFHYNLTDSELEGYKQDTLNDRMLVIANSDRSSHNEVENNNAAYEEVDITHYTVEFEGPKAQFYF